MTDDEILEKLNEIQQDIEDLKERTQSIEAKTDRRWRFIEDKLGDLGSSKRRK